MEIIWGLFIVATAILGYLSGRHKITKEDLKKGWVKIVPPKKLKAYNPKHDPLKQMTGEAFDQFD